MSDEFKSGNFKVILFNGPPRSGKDTSVDLLLSGDTTGTIKKEKFAYPLKAAVKAFYNLNDDEWSYWDSAEHKDQVSDVFLGKTCREAQIAMSEVYAKPFHGKNTVFGTLLARRITDWHSSGIICTSDSGFVEEVYPIMAKFGSDNVILVRVHRDGHDFSIDSRNYVYIDGLKSFDIYNNSTKEALAVQLADVLAYAREGFTGE